jgi:hypothetical protein
MTTVASVPVPRLDAARCRFQTAGRSPLRVRGRMEAPAVFCDARVRAAGVERRRHWGNDRQWLTEGRARIAAPESVAAARKSDSDPPRRP